MRTLVLEHALIPAGQPSHDRHFDLDVKLESLADADTTLLKVILESELSDADKADMTILYAEAITASRLGCNDRLELMTETIKNLPCCQPSSTLPWLDYIYGLLTTAYLRVTIGVRA